MHPHEIHHIKAYIVFSLVSIFFVGILIYLYLPAEKSNNLGSSVLETKTTKDIPEPSKTTQNTPSEATDEDISGRRVRLTKILIRTQKELQTLESQRKNSAQGLDPLTEEKIIKTREKIATIEKMITEMK